jgi:phage tail sheath protein FI
MPEYVYPGVYVEEIERGPRPIEGVPTSTAALLGETERGSIVPRLVASYAEYRRCFGDPFDASKYVPHAMRAFFENGGTRAYVCRVVADGATTATAVFGDFTLQAAGPGSWGGRIFARVSDGTTKLKDGGSSGFRLQVAYWREGVVPFDPFDGAASSAGPPDLIEDFDDLLVDEAAPGFYGARLPFVDLSAGEKVAGADRAALIVLVRHAGAAAGARPANGAQALIGGSDGALPLTVADYEGLPSATRTYAQGLAALEDDAYRDVALIHAPAVAPDIATSIVSHCEKVRFRFAILDAPAGQTDPAGLDPRSSIADSSRAAFYYPWIVGRDASTGATTLVPPGGFVLGIYARVDTQRGVFKAPANELVIGAAGLVHEVDHVAQSVLDPRGVNVIRDFPGRGIRVWGARTLSSDTIWKYVNVRRLFTFLEHSIERGTQWVVFEPNDDRLWARVIDTIRDFLQAQWRAGALLGRTEEEAFFVKCDRSTMTQDDILNGRLICLIGVAPVRPAEFVIFRIGQWTADAKR